MFAGATHAALPTTSPVTALAATTRPADAAARAATRAALDRAVPALQFDHVRFAELMSFFRDMTQATVEVQWDELAKAGISRDSEVTVRMRNVKLRNALRAVLAVVDKTGNGNTTDTAVWAVLEDGHLLVTTQRDFRAHFSPSTQVRYPAMDLIAHSSDPATQNQLKADFRDLIKETVATDTWASAAGAPGGQVVWDGDDLVISQTADVQDDLAEMLRKMRERRPAVGR